MPQGPSGHVAAFVFKVADDDEWEFIGWGASDLRFPHGEYEAQPVVPGEPIEMNLPLEPLDAVVRDGEQLLIVLDQGHADHVPGAVPFPVTLEYGAELGAFNFHEIDPPEADFFEPPL